MRLSPVWIGGFSTRNVGMQSRVSRVTTESLEIADQRRGLDGKKLLDV